MTILRSGRFVSAVFITFSGNCREALTYYQTCFGGSIRFETFEKEELGSIEKPVVIGSLFSDEITVHGSDLVHNEGRTLGNYLAVFLYCKTVDERQTLIKKLELGKEHPTIIDDEDQKLVEIIDIFEVRWILAV